MRFLLLVGAVLVSAPKLIFAEPVFLQHRVADSLNLLTAVPAFSSPSTGTYQIQAALSHVNVFAGGTVSTSSGEEILSLDGETTELELRAQLALTSCLSAAFDSRIISHAGGIFDEEIDTWHDIFALPDAGRQDQPFDELGFGFTNTGNFESTESGFSETETRLTNSSTALGDVWLSVQRPIRCHPNAGKSALPSSGHVRVGVKLPVGDTAAWASGGQAAVFADWHSLPNSIGKRARLTTTLGASYSDEWDERFAALSPRRFIAYGAVVFDYRWGPTWQSVVQLDFRTPGFDSELTELGSWGGQIHVGLRAAVAKHHRIEMSFSEDVIIDTAPDIGVRFAYTYTP